MSLKGNIETFRLSSILQMLNYERRTGRLIIRSSDNFIQIFLHEGDIIYATETRKTNRLGDLLKEAGFISQADLDDCLALSHHNKDRLGKTLVQKGYISAEKLNEFIRKQAENTIFNVLLSESGEFEYTDTEINLNGTDAFKIDTMFVLLEASRRIDEVEILKEQIPGESSIPKIADTTGDGVKASLNANERQLLSVINGTSTVRQAFDKSGFDDFEAYRILNSLISLGLVDFSQPKTTAEMAKEVILLTRRVEPREFRQNLDDLDLKRSSTLRVALSRIFRDAVDEQHIIAAVEKEAIKIGNSPEKNALNKLRKEKQVPYMKNIIELLWQAINEMYE